MLLVISSHHYVNRDITCACVITVEHYRGCLTAAAWPNSECQNAPLPHRCFSALRGFCNNINLQTCSGVRLPFPSTIICSHIAPRCWGNGGHDSLKCCTCTAAISRAAGVLSYPLKLGSAWTIFFILFFIFVTALSAKRLFSESCISDFDPLIWLLEPQVQSNIFVNIIYYAKRLFSDLNGVYTFDIPLWYESCLFLKGAGSHQFCDGSLVSLHTTLWRMKGFSF